MTEPAVQLQQLLAEFVSALLALDRLRSREILAQRSASAGAFGLVESVVTPALERIGQLWEEGTVALSQVYMSARICEGLVGELLPAARAGRPNQPRIAIGVLQDYHFLGRSIVYSVLRSSGYALADYGRVTVEEVVRQATEGGIEILLLSTLMLPAALRVKDVRKGLCQSGAKVKLVVGGAPFRLDKALWQEVGADAMGRTASDAVQIIARLTEGAG
jgi:methanogenic corrinoid protein MtbC1